MKRIFLFLLVCCASYSYSFAQQTFPHLTEICTDNADVFYQEDLLHLREKLKDFENETSHQIVVLTVPNLGNESIENYALQVFEQNRIGQEGTDNGLLILFSEYDKEVRIEVGFGLEPIITDAISARLISTIMIPEFRNFRYYEGIDLATDEIIKIISDPIYAEEFALENSDEEEVKNSIWSRLLMFLLIGGFLSVFIVIGVMLLKTAYKDLVNLYRGLISGEISVFSFPFRFIGVFFLLFGGVVFTIVPIFAALVMLSQIIFSTDINDIMNDIFESSYFNFTSFFILIGFLLVVLPLTLAILIVNRYDSGFKFSFLKSNPNFLKKNISFTSSGSSSGSYRGSNSSSSSRSSGFSSSSRSSSSRSSFSGGGGRSGGGGASGRW